MLFCKKSEFFRFFLTPVKSITQIRSSPDITPVKYSPQKQITRKISPFIQKKGTISATIIPPPITAKVRIGTESGMAMPLVRSKRVRLKIMFTPWLMKKLIKYPSIPHSGSKMYSPATSSTEVKILIRTHIFCLPRPLLMASIMASQYNMGARSENQRRYCPALLLR